ncbi:hypothetical protein [Streptomyces canus]|uniref:hypothetical protein n=1 Tax=Streptomyces canus TaxID=58343 RepID=UPI00037B6DC8|nr:hypothetical protein [Streptomyces canus]
MLHGAPPRAAVLRRARHNVDPVPLIRMTARFVDEVAGFVPTVCVKAGLEVFPACSLIPPLLPTAAAPGQSAGARAIEDQWRAAVGSPAPAA